MSIATPQVDVLFVIDAGPDAGALQGRLADAMDRFAEATRAIRPAPSLRIGFTSTHDDNLACAPRPDSGGRLRLSSCGARPHDFVTRDGDDRFDTLCASRCGVDTMAVEPTRVWWDGEAQPRPWIETHADASNLAEGIALEEALRCASMLGITGCPFSAPLASSHRALERAKLEWEPSHGFFRHNAALVIVYVTAGEDCSVTSTGTAAFDPEGTRALWSDPDADEPTPSVCWHAAARCAAPARTGSGTTQCDPADVGLDRKPADSGSAVLRPVTDYVDYFQRITDLHRQLRPDRETSIIALAGVPTDFADTGEIAYARATDPVLADRYGIAPTCEADGSFVVPPVRLRAFSEATQDDAFLNVQLLSTCEQDYGPAMDRVVDAIARNVTPSCFWGCARDVDPETPGLQVDCDIHISIPREDGIEAGLLPRCEGGPEGARMPPEDTPGCWFPRTGPDLHELCADWGVNLEIGLLWRFGPPPGASLAARCKLSTSPRTDCPGL